LVGAEPPTILTPYMFISFVFFFFGFLGGFFLAAALFIGLMADSMLCIWRILPVCISLGL